MRSGTGVGSEVWSLEAISGDPGACGWSVVLTTLTNDGSVEGSCSFYLVATLSGDARRFGPFVGSYIALPEIDILPPTQVTRLTATSVAGGVNLSCDVPWDAHDGINAAEGLQDIQFLEDGNVIATVAVSPGNSPVQSSGSIGGATGTATRNANDWLVSSAGDNDGAEDAYFYGGGISVTGDFLASVYIESITTGGAPPKPGIIFRSTLDATSAMVHALTQGDGNPYSGARIEYRAGAGLTRTKTGAAVAGFQAPGWLFLSRVGDVWTLYFGNNAESNAPQQVVQTTIALPAAGYLHLPCISTNATQITIQYRNWCVTQLPRASYARTVTGTHSYTARARDRNGNVGTTSPAVTATAQPVAGIAKKWHPGNYMFARPIQSRTATSIDYSLIKNEPNFKGAQILYNWGLLEPTRDNYDFSRIRQHRDQLAAWGKRLWIHFEDNLGNAGSPKLTFDDRVLPKYIDSAEFSGGWTPYDIGLMAKLWVPAVCDRQIALFAALAAEFDNDPWIEGIAVNQETSWAFHTYPAPPDFSLTAVTTQILRLIDTVSQQWKRTCVYASLNWGGTSNLKLEAARCLQRGVGVNGPDFTSLQGKLPGGSTPIPMYAVWDGRDGGVDYRGKIPRSLRYGDAGVMGTGFTCDMAIDLQASTGMGVNYTFWTAKFPGESVNTTEQQWPAIVAAVNARPNNYPAACPSTFTACDIT